MSAYGYVYVPQAVKDGARCRVHVALHGCKQGYNYVDLSNGRPDRANDPPFGNRYITTTGYNEVAEANDIVVLYPQVEGIDNGVTQNPEGCWDWWGYSARSADNPDYYSRDAVQRAPPPLARAESLWLLLQPSEAIGGRQIQLMGRMVDGVSAPEPAHPMRGAVVPVVAELLADEEAKHGGGADERDLADAMLVGKRDQRRRDREGQEDLHGDAREQVEQRHRAGAPVVRAHPGEDDRLDQRGDHHCGQGDEEEELVEAVQHAGIVGERRRREAPPVPQDA